MKSGQKNYKASQKKKQSISGSQFSSALQFLFAEFYFIYLYILQRM